ncbi:MAG: DUF3524 domain-containing protein [Phycisphaerales bacterium]|nr:DUF3524 domain-containing protein [Phycisphaerales bacterium]
MRVLALEPYYGGSHKAFIDGWRDVSRHDWTLLTLPAHKWKWRMRHAALTFANALLANEPPIEFDAVFCTDMLNLAEFRGLAPKAVRDLPTILYFHENQLTYPFRDDEPRDLHFGFTNILSALAADAVWFNSAFHRDDFLDAADDLLRRMPDHVPANAIESIRIRSCVMTPGIALPHVPERSQANVGPLRIVWAARWEHDKNPDDFFAALRDIAQHEIDFRLSVLGQHFKDVPPVFAEARNEFADRIDHWGYLENRDAYLNELARADVFVSTAHHEFFGLAAVEAMACGCVPLLPNRLAYPELIATSETLRSLCLYDGSVSGLGVGLTRIAAGLSTSMYHSARREVTALGQSHAWSRRIADFDQSLKLGSK